MSATPRVYEMEDNYYNDEIFGEVIYNMTFTEAIEKKYIADYKIWLPSIHEDNSKLDNELSIYEIDSVIKAKCKYLYSCLLNNGSRKCIIYCIDTEEIKLMIKAMKKLNDFYCLDFNVNKITSKNSQNERSKILNEFANGNNIQLLFSVRILDECIDIPSCDSIYITYPSQSKIRTIQRLSRCIRIDKNNKFKIGNIYIWCNEYDEILETLSGIKEYDLFFKDKIMVNCIDNYGEFNIVSFKNDKELVSNYLIGIKEFKQLKWEDKLKMVEDYINVNNKLPLEKSIDNNIKVLGSWLQHQQNNYKNNKYNMKNEIIKIQYTNFIEKYKYLFLSNKEEWYNKLNLINDYINKYDDLPTTKNENSEIKSLGYWLLNQQKNYKNNEYNMKDYNIKKTYEEFIEKNKKYLLTTEEKWKDNLKLAIKYINEQNERPIAKNKKIKQIRSWISKQQNNYKTNKQIMKNENIKNLWEKFIKDNKKYFMTNIEIWKYNLYLVDKYIIDYHTVPSLDNENIEIQHLSYWISNQKKNYKIMENNDIKNQWNEFIKKHEKYKKYFMTNIEIWKYNLNLVKKYIFENNKKPSPEDKNNEIKRLGDWLSNQQQNYKNNKQIMKNENIKILWEKFIKKK